MCDKTWLLCAGFIVDSEDVVDIVFDSFEDQFIDYLTDNAFENYPDQFEDAEDDDEFHDAFFSLADEDRMALISFFLEEEFNIETEPYESSVFIGIKQDTSSVDFHISYPEVDDTILQATGIDFSDYEFVVFGSECDDSDDE